MTEKDMENTPAFEDSGGDELPPSNDHPFQYTLYSTRKDRLIWFLMAFTLAPVKLFLVGLFFGLAWIPSRIAVIGLPLLPDKPLSGWRIVLKDLTMFFVRLAGYSAGLLKQTVKGRQASAKEAPVIIMAPHSSSLDTLGPLAHSIIGFPGAVSSIENAHLPVIGAIFRASQCIFVERKDPNSRSKAAQQIKDRVESGGEWPQIIIFPEGFCSNGRYLLPFKVGPFLPGVSVQPMSVTFNNRLDVSSWIDTGPGLVAIWSLLLCTPISSMTVEWHPVYHPSEEEKKDPQLYARNVRKTMSRYLKLPTSDMTYSDLKDIVKQTKPDTSLFALWKSIITKGFVEMPAKKHLY